MGNAVHDPLLITSFPDNIYAIKTLFYTMFSDNEKQSFSEIFRLDTFVTTGMSTFTCVIYIILWHFFHSYVTNVNGN